MRSSDKNNMKKHTIKLGHMATRNATHAPKKGKGASARKDRRNWKNSIKKGMD